MMLMMALQGAQGFTDNFSAARRGVPPPQQGGAQDMVPMMAMMQRNQMANAELEFNRQKFSAEQQQAMRQQEMDAAAAKELGVHPAVLALAREKFGENIAEQHGSHTVGANDRLFFGNQQVAGALPEYHDANFINREAKTATPIAAAQDFLLRKAAAGAQRNITTVDARNVNNGFDAMLAQAQEERKAMTGKTERLGEIANVTNEMADIAYNNPKVFDPTADFDALMTQGEGILKKWAAGEPLTPEQTQYLSAYNRAKQLNVSEGFALVAGLKPISEAEVKLGLQTALGPSKPIPQVMVRAVQAELAAKRQQAMQNEFDAYQAQALETARKGGEGYSPAAHRMHMMEWEKNNPVSADAFQDVLAKLSKKFPYGGGGAAPNTYTGDPNDADAMAAFYNKRP